jgi:hypothetical protein
MEPLGSSCSSMASMANLQVRNMPLPSTAITRSQSSGVASTMVFSGMMPALATSTSMRPKPSTAVLIMRRASSTTETSPTTASTSEPDPASRSRSWERLASSTSVMTRRASSLAKSSAVARPIPFAAPVTTADCPRSLPSPRAVASVTLPTPSYPLRVRRSLAFLAPTELFVHNLALWDADRQTLAQRADGRGGDTSGCLLTRCNDSNNMPRKVRETRRI